MSFKELSQYCKVLILMQILKVVKLKRKKIPNLTISKLNMVKMEVVLSKVPKYISNHKIPFQ